MNELLQRLKIDIGIINPNPAIDARLTSLLNVAKKEIEREGVTINLENVDDGELVLDSARYLWYNRRGDNNPESAMPKSIRWRINNRLFGKERKAQNPEVDENG